jgi:hypothetical protein
VEEEVTEKADLYNVDRRKPAELLRLVENHRQVGL